MASTEQAKDAAQQATQQAKDTAQQATQQARGRVRDEVDRRSTDFGEQATSVADAIRQASSQLRDQGNHQAAKPMDQAAERVERAGQWLRDSDGDRILRDVEDFGRRNPLAVAAGGLAIGFALSRMLKASSSDRYHGRSAHGTSDTGDRYLPATTPARPPVPATPPGATTSPAGPGATQPGPVPPGSGPGVGTPRVTPTPPSPGIAVPDLPAPEPRTRTY